MKKLLKLLVAFSMCATLAACSSSDESSDSDDGTAKLALITDTGSVTDKSFNQSAYEAIEAFGEENGISYKYYKPADTDTAGLYETIEQAIDNGAELIVTPGFNFHAAVYQAQEDYPDVKFVIIDTAPYTEDDASDTYVADNTIVYLFQENESGYAAGYALVKEGYTSLGFMGGMAGSAVMNYGVGYLQGASDAAVELGVDVEILYHYTGTYSESPEIKTLSDSWYTSGTEVIFSCGGSICNSVFASAEENDALTVGVDTDQSDESETVLTSALKDVYGATYEALEAYLADSFEGGQTIVKSNCGGCVYDSEKFSNFTEDDYNALIEAIEEGSIDLYTYEDINEDGDPTNIDFPNVTVNYE